MKKFLAILFLTFTTCSRLFGQQATLKPFVLEGTISLDTGTVLLRMIADSTFYNASARNLKGKIKAGKFLIKGEILQATAFSIEVENKYYTDIIIIKPTSQRVQCNIEVMKEKLFVDRPSKTEYETFREASKAARFKDSLYMNKRTTLEDQYKAGLPEHVKAALEAETKSIYDESDRAFLSFVKENPGADLALWRTIQLSSWGYEKILDDIFQQMTDTLQLSFAGEVLSAKLSEARRLAIGNKFPYMNLVDEFGNKSEGMSFGKNKYTLVDFWYTNCGPCRAQFPSFIKTYKLHQPKGFELIGISTDAEKYKEDLSKAIRELGLNWRHFWDVNGEQTAALSINAFPTNFLLDKQGVIIQKNISPAELAIFLQGNL